MILKAKKANLSATEKHPFKPPIYYRVMKSEKHLAGSHEILSTCWNRPTKKCMDHIAGKHFLDMAKQVIEIIAVAIQDLARTNKSLQVWEKTVFISCLRLMDGVAKNNNAVHRSHGLCHPVPCHHPLKRAKLDLHTSLC